MCKLFVKKKISVYSVIFFKLYQKTTEGLFKELKFVKEGDLDEAELLKYVDKVIEDNEWKPVFQAIIKDCHKKVNAKLSTVQTKMEAAPFNVKKDQCNVKYGSLLTCTKIDSFDVRIFIIMYIYVFST